MDNPLIFQILGVVLVLFFCFLTYMNTRVWRATHVVFTFLAFAGTIGFLVYAALTLKSRSIWQERAQKLEVRLDEEKSKVQKITYGNLEEIPQVTDSVQLLQEKIYRAGIDRGRVWRGCTVVSSDGTGVVLNTARTDQPAGTQPQPNHIKFDATQGAEKIDKFYAFKETLIPELGAKVPTFFLGEFEATAATDTTVSLRPVHPLDIQQQQEIANVNSTWVLYETMPVDNQQAFQDNGQNLTEDELKTLMPLERTGFVDVADYNKFIQDFVRSGTDFQETDPPENKWVQVKFAKPFKVKVDGDSPGLMVIERNAFDQHGQAVLPRLQRGTEVEFEPGDEAIFFGDDEVVRSLIADETVKLVKNLYVRPLVDFDLVIGHYFQRTEEIQGRIKELSRDLASLQVADAQLVMQIQLKTDEKNKLDQDLKFVKYERDQIKDYTSRVEQQIGSVKQRMTALYKYNIEQEKNLSAINARLKQEIDKKTKEATSASQG